MGDVGERMMWGGGVNGYGVYCFYLLDGYEICKWVVCDGVGVVGVKVERNLFGEMCGESGVVMVDVIVGEEEDVEGWDNMVNRNGEV